MKILGLDIGSSSVKAGILRESKILGSLSRRPFTTHYSGSWVQVNPTDILSAIKLAIHQLGPAAKKCDAIALSVMSPAWVAMDRSGQPITPLVTHQDRRSISIALALEKRVGKSRHLRLAGNRPFPGGISSTTYRWFLENSPGLMKRACLVGHLNTFLHRQFTGSRVIDPSNASFTGLYSTLTQKGWNDDLIRAVGADRAALPEILESNVIGGKILPAAASKLGLLAGTPMTVGLVDTSSAMILAGTKSGQLLNMCGSTDVLGLCVLHPRPHEMLLTRALGIGRKWMSVATLAAAGSALEWTHQILFSDLSPARYHRLLARLATARQSTSVNFDPYLAGQRTSIEQRQAAFTQLTLGATRQEMLQAVIESLAAASAARIHLLKLNRTPLRRRVLTSGGAARHLEAIFHRDWPGEWDFHFEPEASLRGLGTISPLRA